MCSTKIYIIKSNVIKITIKAYKPFRISMMIRLKFEYQDIQNIILKTNIRLQVEKSRLNFSK